MVHANIIDCFEGVSIEKYLKIDYYNFVRSMAPTNILMISSDKLWSYLVTYCKY
jgi:hypothetical protein